MTQKEQKTDINKYVNLLIRKRHLAITISLIISALFVLFAYLKPPEYEASSSVMVEDNVITNLMEGITVQPTLDDKLRNISAAMTSRSLITNVMEKMGLDKGLNDQQAVDRIVDYIRRNMKIKIGGDGRRVSIFTVSFRDHNPGVARDMVNTIINSYIARNIMEQTDEASGASKFLSNQITEFKNKIGAIDRKIMEYRKNHGIYSAIDEKIILEDIKTIQKNIDDIEIEKMELEGKQSYIEKQLKQNTPSASNTMTRRTGATMEDRLMALQKELNELLTKYTEKYPEVIRVKSEMEILEEQIKAGGGRDESTEQPRVNITGSLNQELNDDLAKIEYDIAGLTAKQESYRQLIASKKNELKNVPEEKKRLADMEQERDSYKNIYERLIQRLSQSEVTTSMETGHEGMNFKVVDPAVLPAEPISPKKLKLILLGILAGLAGGIGIVIAMDELDGTFKSYETLKRQGIRILGIVPEIQTPKELTSVRRYDVIMVSITGLYYTGILYLLAKEFFGI